MNSVYFLYVNLCDVHTCIYMVRCLAIDIHVSLCTERDQRSTLYVFLDYSLPCIMR